MSQARLPVELGCPGHFHGSSECLWRRHTQVGNLRVSTVGDHKTCRNKKEPYERIPMGFYGDEEMWYETMVFLTSNEPAEGSDGCGCKRVSCWHEISRVLYGAAGEAQVGHEELVRKLVFDQEFYEEMVGVGESQIAMVDRELEEWDRQSE